ncbi:hypothetical protein QP794_32000 [Paenibacillus sp. UMB7766-LJ446]|jgi:hypothetical protein|uniref:hypothetical protein n=1 Tax=Paenibacillus TaxID=44249 RepID=UPI0004D5AB9B|nr:MULTISPECIES: hypothetical protein [unclassified Paenibacillus]MDK8194716.1 hypothetical protein [Paenibacillus sp. UMB7766-LJ446]GAK43391.1 hypothetical protein TCA2_5888 [Paenibacillus sp. TCA20]SDX86086.1 hypothetical protein SAMN05518848_12046 [Paenibacillus sp. PDC88]
MEKGSVRAIALAYQTATLTYPSFEIMELLRPLPFERVLELLLIMRQSPRPVKSPLNFLRRAIQEGWSPETMPEKVDRHMEYVEENHYIRQGYTIDQAREKVQRNRR